MSTTGGKISVRYASGDDLIFDDGVTLGEIKVHVASKAQCFAPDIKIVGHTCGQLFTKSRARNLPPIVYAVVSPVDYDWKVWRRAMRLHGRAGDAGGLVRARHLVDADRRLGFCGVTILNIAFMKELRSNHTYEEDGRGITPGAPPRRCSTTAFLHAGADVLWDAFQSETFLFAAAGTCTARDVVELLEARAEVDHVNHAGCTPLFEAARVGNLGTVTALVEAQADVNHAIAGPVGARREGGFTPLFVAARYGHLAVVETLLENRADVNHTLSDGWTCFKEASFYGHTHVTDRFSQAGARNVHPAAQPEHRLIDPQAVEMSSEGRQLVELQKQLLSMLTCAADTEREVNLTLEFSGRTARYWATRAFYMSILHGIATTDDLLDAQLPLI